MSAFFRGVIEGFYGRQWSWQARHDYADFLKGNNYQYYIYAPKGDPYLRSKWRDPWPDADYKKLQSLAACYHNKSVGWGLGLSPLELFKDYSGEQKVLLLDKVAAINDLMPDVLCILFDDMPGGFPLLAERQLAIIEDILSVSKAKKHIVCPTYYSFDPVLEAVFGKMPSDYLRRLGEELTADIDIFWTGDKVISPSLSRESIDRAGELLGRRPVIWDNYLANDGRCTADYLRIGSVEGRASDVQRFARGQVLNPMNQPYLSMLPLSLMAGSYKEGGFLMGQSVLGDSSVDPRLLNCLQRDRLLFSEGGLAAINENQRLILGEEYAKIVGPAAREICDWLAGEYSFDPECLTG